MLERLEKTSTSISPSMSAELIIGNKLVINWYQEEYDVKIEINDKLPLIL